MLPAAAVPAPSQAADELKRQMPREQAEWLAAVAGMQAAFRRGTALLQPGMPLALLLCFHSSSKYAAQTPPPPNPAPPCVHIARRQDGLAKLCFEAVKDEYGPLFTGYSSNGTIEIVKQMVAALPAAPATDGGPAG